MFLTLTENAQVRVSDHWQSRHLSQTVLCCGGCPVPCRTISCIPGIYLLDANIPQLWQQKVSPDITNCPLKDTVSLRVNLRPDTREKYIIW